MRGRKSPFFNLDLFAIKIGLSRYDYLSMKPDGMEIINLKP